MTEGLSDRDLLAFRTIADPTLSPDGSLVAFTLIEQDAKANRQASSIWVCPADGSQPPRRLTVGPRDSRPRWSPDGRRLGFLAAREREWAKDLYLLDMEGGEPQPAAKLPRGIADYAWGPENCLCLAGAPDFPPDPDRDPPSSSEEAHRRYQERPLHVTRLRYRMDGQGYLDDEPRQLWVVEPPGEPRLVAATPGDVLRPRWLSDGRVAFLANLEPDRDISEAVEVYVADLKGGWERLTRDGRPTLAFAQGESHLATVAPEGSPRFGRHPRLWLDGACASRGLDRPVGGGGVLADTLPSAEPADPIWWHGQVYFEVADRGRVHLYRLRPGGEPEPVLVGDRVVRGWSVAGGRIAFVTTSPEEGVSLRVADADGGAEGVLFDPNPWLKERALGTLRRLEVRRDGCTIDGWALLPPGYREGERVPTLLYIHGGPHAAYGWSFQFVFQVLAGAGYGVVFCNPPGSQSYSEEFSLSLAGAWGERDFPWLMALADRAVEAGFADPERMGVGGASYGGYATLWVISHTDRFRAAVCARPVSTLEGFYGSSDVAWEFAPGEIGAHPWQDPERYRRLSPLTHLDLVTTPVRLIAGTADLRTPVEEAEQVYVRLRRMDKDADLVIFPGESHLITVNGRPWNRVRHMRYVQEWFDRYLKA